MIAMNNYEYLRKLGALSVHDIETRQPDLWTGKTKMRTGVYLSGRVNCFFLNSYVSRSPVRRTAQRALHVIVILYRHVCIS